MKFVTMGEDRMRLLRRFYRQRDRDVGLRRTGASAGPPPSLML